MLKVASYLFDALLVILFAAIGRATHHHGTAPEQVLTTAWPFLIGLTVAWSMHVTVLRSLKVMQQGILVWCDTVVLGLLIRMLAHQGVAWSFVLVTAITLLVFFQSWRALYVLTGGEKKRAKKRQSTSEYR
ncbi:MAG: DUF3054 domain-containing protein [Propionibacteriaceae bacterium]